MNVRYVPDLTIDFWFGSGQPSTSVLGLFHNDSTKTESPQSLSQSCVRNFEFFLELG